MVLAIFEQNNNSPLNAKQVSAKLNIGDPESREIIFEILKEEVQKNVLKEISHGKFQLHELKTFIDGIVDLTNDGSAYIVTDDPAETDIFIAPRKLRNALNGDRVRVYVYAKTRGQRKEGEVIEILQRNKMEFTGIVKLSERFAFFIPDDRKMMHDIFIPISELNGAKNGIKAVAEITDWPPGARNPIGRIKQVLGVQGENDTEMNAILAEYGFPLSFTKDVEDESEAISDKISDDEIRRRRDFRNVLTFTVDPFDAKDFDDALSFKKLENGNYEVGIHIADVSHYIQPDSALDKEALDRATSVYLVDRVIPMLPERLSNGLCSLRPREDKLCFAAIFELNEEAFVVNEWFGKTIINSDKRFTYEDVQQIIEDKSGDFFNEILKLNGLAHKLRERKFRNGAISFESTEVKFRLDEAGHPTGVYIKERKDAHKLIEDFMLLANRIYICLPCA
jgi:ribonuclease R